QIQQRDLIRVTNIYGLLMIAHQQPVNTLYKIIYITKTPGLASVTKNGQVFSTQGLSDKSRQCPPVIQPHSWSIGVKYSYDPGLYIMKSMIGHGNGFLETFGFIIYTTWTYRIYITPILFILRMYQRVSINFAG